MAERKSFAEIKKNARPDCFMTFNHDQPSALRKQKIPYYIELVVLLKNFLPFLDLRSCTYYEGSRMLGIMSA